MKCQVCGQVATHHVTEMMAGKPVEHHVCETHFHEMGVLEPPPRPTEPPNALAAFHSDATLWEADEDEDARQKLAAHLLPALCLALLDEKPEVRIAAAFRLTAFGPDARSALPALESALQDAEERVRKASQIAIEMIRKGDPTFWYF